MDQRDIARLDRICAHLRAVLHQGQLAPLDLEDEPDDEIRQVGVLCNQLTETLAGLTMATRHLSQGELDFPIPGRLAACHNLKNLQATLRHLVWQTGQIAQGDFSQRVEFLGDFSVSFNWMVEQLESNHHRILEQNRELERLASIDPLTGVCNRRCFMESGQREFSRARRYGQQLCLMQMDLDHFKQVNDTYGHAAGDEVLRVFAANCRQGLREHDLLGRLGGEEFAVVLPATDLDGACQVAERFREIVAEIKLFVDEKLIRFTVSIGVAQSTPEDRDVEALLRRADEALYLAKNGGRNRVVVAK